MDFHDKTVLITGAVGGIGTAATAAFAEQGAKLVLVDLSMPALEKIAADAGLADDRILLLEADVGEENQVIAYVRSATKAFGRIDVLFSNAGIEGRTGALVDTAAETLDAILSVNVKGSFFGIKHVMAAMIAQQSGVIVNMSSMAGLIGFPGLGVYTASKHAVIGIERTAALESAGSRVRVNAVCPGPVDTRMMRGIESGMSAEDLEGVKTEFANSTAMKRYAQPEEIAQLVLFLASDKASYITGSVYTADGGMDVRRDVRRGGV